MYFSTTFIVSIMSLETVSYPNEEQLSFQKSTKKRLTPKRSFKFVADYDTAEEAKQFMEEHGSYSVVRTYNVKSGIKEEYRCNKVLLRGMACSSAFYIIYSCTDLSCSLYHTDSDHSCQEINENPDNRAHGIDQHTKTIIIICITDQHNHFHPHSITVCTNEKHDDYAFVFHALQHGIRLIGKLLPFSCFNFL